MVRELAIEGYLVLVRLVFTLCKLFPLQNKVTFMVSFEENNLFIYREMQRQNVSVPIVFLYKGKHKERFDRQIGRVSIPLEVMNPLAFIRSLYHLATSKKVVLDNYFGLLAAVNFKKSVECVQIWHAAGAMKTFGHEDLSVQTRSARANLRFQQVYNHFHKIVVGSDIMADRFLKAFHLPEKVILKTGVPRTDLFYNEEAKQQAIDKLEKENPFLKEKKVILYAPTYRDQDLDAFKLELDLKKMQDALSQSYILLLRLHPAIKGGLSLEGLDPQFVFDYTGRHEMNELLFVTDLLITDYSSIPYEFSILGKPMVFFAYDEETYLGERGLWEAYKDMVPGPVVKTTEELVNVILKEAYDKKHVQAFAEAWNRYSKGRSSENLVTYLLRQENTHQESRNT
jgi:teichoic acid glycerol-phosphate primase